MKEKEDIFEIYNDMEKMLNSIDLNNDDTLNKKNELHIPEMPKIFVDLHDNTSEFLSDVIQEQKDNQTKNIFETLEENNKLNDIFIEPNNLLNQLDEQITEEEIKLNLENEINNEFKNDLIVEDKKENNKIKDKKKKKKLKKWVITFGILDFIAIVCLFLMYGPISYFRNLWVTSAMTTMTHKYLAYVFFTPNQVKEIMNNNTVIESGESTNIDEIIIEEEPVEQIEYSSIYEEQVLKRDEGNDLYKVVELSGDGYKGHMLVVYDPSKIKLARITNPKYGLTIQEFSEKYNAVAGINAGGFYYSKYSGYSPVGPLISDGKIISNRGTTGWGGGIVGFTYNNVLVLSKASASEAINMGVRDAVSFGPFLIVNGVPSEFKGNGGYGLAPRTAIGQRKDGIVLMVVIDGRRPGHSVGIDMVELTNIFINYGAYNASNLDGGGSSTLVVNGETLSIAGGYGYSGDRYLPNSWLVTQ